MTRTAEPPALPRPVGSRGAKPLYVACALAVAGVVAFQWLHAPRRTAPARADTTNSDDIPITANTSIPIRALASPTRAPEPAPQKVTTVSSPAPRAVTSPDHEPTEAERKQERQRRFDHIQGIFSSQIAKDFEPERARRLERALEAPLAKVAETARTLEVGRLECRGRMCGLDVGFDDQSEMVELNAQVRQAVIDMRETLPRMHLVTRAGDAGKENVGRLFFEWLDSDREVNQ